MTRYVRPLDEVGMEDVQQCGGKGANLGELTRLGVRVPPGFCIVAAALASVLAANSLEAPIAEIAAGLSFDDPNALEAETARIRSLIFQATTPQELEAEILDHYRALISDENRYVAVRSSVAIRDSPV